MLSIRHLQGCAFKRNPLFTSGNNFTSLTSSISRHHHKLISRQLTPHQITRPYSYKRYFPSSGPSRARRAIIPGIIVSCIGVFAWESTTQTAARNGSRSAMKQLSLFRDNMVLSLRNIQEGRYWTTLTPIFAHVSLLHLIVNMMALGSFGPLVMSYFGTTRFLTIFFGSGVAGSLAHIAWNKNQHVNPNEEAVGASGAICGLLGAAAMLMPRGMMTIMMVPVEQGVGTALFATWSLACLKEGWVPWIGHAGHLGGLAYGALYVVLMMKFRRRR